MYLPETGQSITIIFILIAVAVVLMLALVLKKRKENDGVEVSEEEVVAVNDDVVVNESTTNDAENIGNDNSEVK